MPNCIICYEEKSAAEFKHIRQNGLLGRCKTCMYLATKAWKAANPKKTTAQAARWRKRHPEKSRARQANHKISKPEHVRAREILNYAIRRGFIVRLPCARCGNVKSEAHHDDYSRPLHVDWLCKEHHEDKRRSVAVKL
jgi:hypothetical protein